MSLYQHRIKKKKKEKQENDVLAFVERPAPASSTSRFSP